MLELRQRRTLPSTVSGAVSSLLFPMRERGNTVKKLPMHTATGKRPEGWPIRRHRQSAPTTEKPNRILTTPVSLLTPPHKEDNRIFITVKIEGHQYTALIDTGACKSHINQDVITACQKEGVQFRRPGISQALLADGGLSPITQEAILKFEFDGIITKEKFLALPSMSVPVLLGMDILRKRGMKINLATDPDTDHLASTDPINSLAVVEMPRSEGEKLENFLQKELQAFQEISGTTKLAQHRIKLKDPDIIPIK